MNTIVTPRREAFYWLAILCTFARWAPAPGDLVSGTSAWATWPASGSSVAPSPVIALLWGLEVLPVTAFWASCVLTRPLDCLTLGDLLTASHHAGGLALGTNTTSRRSSR